MFPSQYPFQCFAPFPSLPVPLIPVPFPALVPFHMLLPLHPRTAPPPSPMSHLQAPFAVPHFPSMSQFPFLFYVPYLPMYRFNPLPRSCPMSLPRHVPVPMFRLNFSSRTPVPRAPSHSRVPSSLSLLLFPLSPIRFRPVFHPTAISNSSHAVFMSRYCPTFPFHFQCRSRFHFVHIQIPCTPATAPTHPLWLTCLYLPPCAPLSPNARNVNHAGPVHSKNASEYVREQPGALQETKNMIMQTLLFTLKMFSNTWKMQPNGGPWAQNSDHANPDVQSKKWWVTALIPPPVPRNASERHPKARGNYRNAKLQESVPDSRHRF